MYVIICTSYRKEVNRMYSLNSSFNRIFNILVVAFIIVGVAMLFFNVVPFVLATAVVIWTFIYVIKFIKAVINKLAAPKDKNSIEVTLDKDEFDLTEKNIIDVEYREV